MRKAILLFALLSACGDAEVETVTRTHVFQTIDFGRLVSRRVAEGFDLDGMATNSREARGCAQDDFTSPDGTPGVDNNFAVLIPLLDLAAEGALQALIQTAVNEGRLLVFLEEFEDGRGQTGLRFRRGDDSPLLGTDGRLLPGQTLGLHLDADLGTAPDLTLTQEGSTLEARGFDVRLPAVIFETLYVLEFRDARIRYEAGDDGRLVGMLGGGVELDQIFEIIRTADAQMGASIEDLIGEELRNLADLTSEEGDCQRLSATVTFEAVPAFVF